MTAFIEHSCTLEVPGWIIPAALTVPAHSPLASAVLLVPGSLFSDVNGDYPAWNSFPHTNAHLARKLSALGHAVYRYAKLGPGTGSVERPAPQPVGRTWEGRHHIAAAALKAMRAELAARALEPARIIGAGHSEGAVVVSVLALSAGEIDGVVLLSGPSVGILQIMREQAARGVGRDVEATLASMPEEARQYLRDVEATDPLRLARELKQPVLVVQGGNDEMVPAHHGKRLRDAARAEYLFVPEVSHLYKVLPPGVSGPAAFGYPGETDSRVTDGIDRWIRRK
ncbi:MAG TPA: hypothetical protein VH083_07570 [Myxococcales bacterium]|nr:hypothetical protein [Myxococcales bacterium]